MITRSGRVIAENVAEFVNHGRAPDGLQRQGDLFEPRIGKQVKVPYPCVLAKRPWYRNYGQWLVDCAAVVALAADMIRREGLAIVVGAQNSDKMSSVVRETLEIVAPGAPFLGMPDDEIWTFSDLRYFTPMHVAPLFKYPDALKALRARVLGGTEFQCRQRLFVSRGPATARKLVNEDELLNLCQAQGFTPVQPERLGFREQARLFADAEIVIGVKGAALTNCLFCSPSATVVIMAPDDFPDPFFWDICGQMGLRYGEIYGRSVGEGPTAKKPFTIDAARLSALIDTILQESSNNSPDVPRYRMRETT